MYVKDYMHTALTTVTPDTLMSTAYQMMTMRGERIRHLPVITDQQTLVGVITDRDVREASPSPATTLTHGEIAYRMETTPIKTCMTKDVVCIGPDVEMEDAARLLLQRKVGCLPVVDNNTLVGVVTEMDCLRAFLETASSA